MLATMGMKVRGTATNAAVTQASSAPLAGHEAYIASVDEQRRGDIRRLHQMVLDEAPQLAPTMQFRMMGTPVMGYGPFDYKYASGRSGTWFKVGIAAQKKYLSLYCCACDSEGYVAERFASRLPKANIGRSCVRFASLEHLDEQAIRELIVQTAEGHFGI